MNFQRTSYDLSVWAETLGEPDGVGLTLGLIILRVFSNPNGSMISVGVPSNEILTAVLVLFRYLEGNHSFRSRLGSLDGGR